MDEEAFMMEIETDKEMRVNMNLYKSEIVAKEKEGEGDDGANAEMSAKNDEEVRIRKTIRMLWDKHLWKRVKRRLRTAWRLRGVRRPNWFKTRKLRSLLEPCLVKTLWRNRSSLHNIHF